MTSLLGLSLGELEQQRRLQHSEHIFRDGQVDCVAQPSLAASVLGGRASSSRRAPQQQHDACGPPDQLGLQQLRPVF